MKHWLKEVAIAVGIFFVFTSTMVMAEKNESKKLKRAVISIDNLTCGACFSTISSGLDPLDGYSGMGANLFRKLIAVDFSTPLTQEQITQKLTEVGYPGTVQYVENISEKESFVYLESKRSGFSSGAGGGCARGASSGSCCPTPPASAPVSAPATGQQL